MIIINNTVFFLERPSLQFFLCIPGTQKKTEYNSKWNDALYFDSFVYSKHTMCHILPGLGTDKQNENRKTILAERKQAITMN